MFGFSQLHSRRRLASAVVLLSGMRGIWWAPHLRRVPAGGASEPTLKIALRMPTRRFESWTVAGPTPSAICLSRVRRVIFEASRLRCSRELSCWCGPLRRLSRRGCAHLNFKGERPRPSQRRCVENSFEVAFSGSLRYGEAPCDELRPNLFGKARRGAPPSIFDEDSLDCPTTGVDIDGVRVSWWRWPLVCAPAQFQRTF